MYKTIVLHVDGSSRQEGRLHAAALLARAFDAHVVGSAVTGVSWTELVLLAGSITAPVTSADFDILRKNVAGHLDAFSGKARRMGIESFDTCLIDDVPDRGLLMQSRYADLVILSQDVEEDSDNNRSAHGLAARARRLPEHIALHSPRPVLVVPERYRGQAIPGTVVAGWDGSPQAIRALTAALPLLTRADKVKLALINADELSELHGEQPGADIALWLARHGVRVEVVLERTASTTGHALISLARDCGAGMMVCGAYGHSRYREWVLGGVTRELLARSPVPLLIAR